MPTQTTPARRTVALIIRCEPHIAKRVREAAASDRRSVSAFGALALEHQADNVLATGQHHEQAA